MLVTVKCPYCTTHITRYIENDLHEQETKEKILHDHCAVKHPEKLNSSVVNAPIVDMNWKRSYRIDYGTGMI